MKPLLIVRPRPGGDATAERARAMGLKVLMHPLFVVEATAWTPPDPARLDALLLTSANAVRHAGPALARFAGLPCFAVGRATAAEAAAAGLHLCDTGVAGVGAALSRIEARGLHRVLHLAGRDRHPYPRTTLSLTTCTVYAAQEADVTLPPAPYVALLHSERAAARLARLVPQRRAIDLVAISADVGVAAGEGWRHVAIAPNPDDSAMLALAAQLCEEGAMPTAGAA